MLSLILSLMLSLMIASNPTSCGYIGLSWRCSWGCDNKSRVQCSDSKSGFNDQVWCERKGSETCAGNTPAQCPGSMYVKMYWINLQVQTTSSMYWFNVADLSGLLSIMLRPPNPSKIMFAFYVWCPPSSHFLFTMCGVPPPLLWTSEHIFMCGVPPARL